MNCPDSSALENLYDWLDTIPFSRPKKNLARDFSDAILAAELILHFFPHMIQMHNYSPSNSVALKKHNWETLSRKVLIKLDYPLSDRTIQDLASAKLEATEYVLHTLRGKIDDYMKQKRKKTTAKGQNVTCGGCEFSSGDDSSRANLKGIQDLQEPKWTSSGENKIDVQSGGLGIKNGKHIIAEGQCWFPKEPGFDSVPRPVYEQKEQEVLMREETIQILQARIRRLEYTLHLKDMRIEELTLALNEMQNGKVVSSEKQPGMNQTSKATHSPKRRVR